jgi:flagellar protein FliS
MTQEEIRAFSYRITQATPTGLIVVLYEMAEKYLDDAVDSINKDKPEEFRTGLKAAGQVIDELNHSLDMQYGISLYLMRIYVYMKEVFLRASVSLEVTELNKCRGMLGRLKESFKEIQPQDQRGPVMSNTQRVYAGLTYGRGTLNESFGPESNRGFRV